MLKFLFILPKCDVVQTYGYQRSGLAYVASSLRAYGYHVFGIDLTHAEDEEAALKEALIKNCIDVVCMGMLITDYNEVKSIIAIVKQIKSDIKIVIGGVMLSTSAEIIMKNIPVDFGVIGPGEETICELADALAAGEGFHHVDGLIFRGSAITDVLVKTKPRKDMADIDNIPYPCYELFSSDNSLRHNTTLTISASRSCPFHCTFCYHHSNKYMQRSLDSIFDELDYWLGKYRHISHIMFMDDLFSVDKNRVIEFCDRIKKYKLKYHITFRVSDVSEDIFESSVLYASGCQSVGYGLENVNNIILKSMRKGTTLEEIEKALKMTYDANLAINGYFIFGDKEETMETANNTINWWLKHLHYKIECVWLDLYPGTQVYQYAIDNKLITNEAKYLEDRCPFINISKLTEDEVKFMQRRLASMSRILWAGDAVTLHSRTEDNICSGRAQCFRCGEYYEFRNIPFQGGKLCYCEKCNSTLYIRPSQASDTLEPSKISVHQYQTVTSSVLDKLFERYATAHKTIAVWGAGIRTEVLMDNSRMLSNCVTKIVDTNFTMFSEKSIHSMSIDNPETLKYEVIDLILVTVVAKKDEVINTIRNELGISSELLAI